MVYFDHTILVCVGRDNVVGLLLDESDYCVLADLFAQSLLTA